MPLETFGHCDELDRFLSEIVPSWIAFSATDEVRFERLNNSINELDKLMKRFDDWFAG